MPPGNPATTPASVGLKRRLRLLMLVLALFLGWAGYTLAGQEGQLSQRRTELRESVQRLNEVTAQTEAVKQEIARLNDPEYIGQIARKQQGMGLPGETPIQIEKYAP